jgi:hypothetical protein
MFGSGVPNPAFQAADMGILILHMNVFGKLARNATMVLTDNVPIGIILGIFSPSFNTCSKRLNGKYSELLRWFGPRHEQVCEFGRGLILGSISRAVSSQYMHATKK